MSKDRIRRYSDAAPQEMQAKLRRIAARNGDFFKTRELGVASEGETSSIRRWAEARKNAETGLWNVKQFQKHVEYLKRTQDGELKNGGVLTQAAILKDACFFDALYACAQLESADMRDTDPAQAEKARETAGGQHYQAFAEAEGIVFDARDNMPVPVADGEILSDDCVLNDNALEVAGRAQGNLVNPGPVKIGNIIGAELSLPAIVSAPSAPLSVSGMMRDIDSSLNSVNVEGARKSAMEGLQTSYAFAVKNRFDRTGERKQELTGGDAGAIKLMKKMAVGGAGVLAASLLAPVLAAPAVVVGAAYIIGGGMAAGAGVIFFMGSCMHGPVKWVDLMAKNGNKKVEAAFQKDMRNVRRQIADLPTGQMQAEAKAAADHIEFGFRILSLRHAFRRAGEAGALKRPYARHILKGEFAKLVEKAKEFGVEEGNLAVIVESIRSKEAAAGLERHAEASIEEQLRKLNEIFVAAKGDVRMLAAPQGTEDAKKAAPLLRRAISLMPPQP